jgi:hypothetical protein
MRFAAAAPLARTKEVRDNGFIADIAILELPEPLRRWSEDGCSHEVDHQIFWQGF